MSSSFSSVVRGSPPRGKRPKRVPPVPTAHDGAATEKRGDLVDHRVGVDPALGESLPELSRSRSWPATTAASSSRIWSGVMRIGHGGLRSAQEGGGDTTVDRDEQAGRARQRAADQCDDGVGHMLGHDTLRRARCVTRRSRRAPRARRRTPRPGASRQAPSKMPEPSTTPSGFTPLTRMPCRPSSAASRRTWWAWSALAAP